MPQNRRQKFVALGLALVLCTSLLPTAVLAAESSTSYKQLERPKASEITSGYLLIGTFLVQKDMLSQSIMDVAKASMEQSDQGMYYKSEFAKGAWFNIQNGTDISAILGTGGTVVENEQIDGMKITVWVYKKDGKPKIASLQTLDEINVQIDLLKKQQDKAKDDNKKAMEDNDDETATTLAFKVASIQAQIDFMEALKSGNDAAASAALDQQADSGKILDNQPDTESAAQEVAKKQVEATLQQVEADLKQAEATGNQQAIAQLTAELKQAQESGNTSTAAKKEVELQTVKDIGNHAVVEKLQGQLQLVQQSGNQALVDKLDAQLQEVKAIGNQAALVRLQTQLQTVQMIGNQGLLAVLAAQLKTSKGIGDAKLAVDLKAAQDRGVVELKALLQAAQLEANDQKDQAAVTRLDALLKAMEQDGPQGVIAKLVAQVNEAKAQSDATTAAQVEALQTQVLDLMNQKAITELTSEEQEAKSRGTDQQAAARLTVELQAAKDRGDQAVEQLQAEIKTAQDRGNETAILALIAQQQSLTKQLADFAAGALTGKADAAKEDQANNLLALKKAVQASQQKEALASLDKLKTGDKQLEQLQQAQLQKQLDALTAQETPLKSELQKAGSGELAAQLQAQLQDLQTKKATLQLALLDEQKQSIQAESLKLQAVLETAKKLGESDVVAQLTAKLDDNAVKIEAIKQQEQGLRLSALKEEQKKQETALQQAKDAGNQALADQLLIALVQAKAQVAAQDQGVADQVLALQQAEQLMNKQLENAVLLENKEMETQLREGLPTVHQNLVKAQKEELFVEKSVTAGMQAEVVQATGKPSDVLAKHQTDVIEQIKQLEKQKYSAEDLANLQRVKQQMEQELGTDDLVLPVENIISKDVDLKFQVPPCVIGGTTFIHIRPISEAFGSQVNWYDDDQSITVIKGQTVVKCKIGDTTAYIDGQKIRLETPPRLVAGRTMVPLRFVSEALGLNVYWDQTTRSIEIKGLVK